MQEVIKEAGLKPAGIDEVILVGGQTKMPLIQRRVEELIGKKPHKDINPDEVVAMGPAIQAGDLQGDVKDVLLLDVTPLTPGIETLGGVRTPIIEKNTTIPAKQTQIFSTAADNQTSVEINVLQGEREMAADNHSLGRFILEGLPPAPRGIPQIEVTFDIDANGILKVTARDKKTNKEQTIRIEATSDLTEEEIEKMRQEAEAHREEDRKKLELARVRNEADSLVYTARKSLKEHQAKIDDNLKKELEAKVKELEEVTKSDDADKIKEAIQALSQVFSQIGAKIYSSDSGQEPDSAKSGDSAS
jgi:molecular chaperone DnaK